MTNKEKLTLDRVASYQIQAPGHLDDSWADWVEGLVMATEINDEGRPITTLSGTLDQAALQGLLRRLYSLGIPLISATCLD